MAETLKRYTKELDGKNFFLATKNLSFNECNEITYNGYGFKVSDNLFENTNMELVEQIEKDWFTEINSKIYHENLREELKNRLGKSLKKDNKNFREIKSILNFIKILDKWNGLSEENQELTSGHSNFSPEVASITSSSF